MKRTVKHPVIVMLVALLALGVIAASIGGCVGVEQAREDAAALQEIIDQSREEAARVRAELDALPPESKGKAEALELLGKITDVQEKAAAALEQLNARIASAEDDLDVIEALGTTAAGAIPGYGPIIALGITTFIGFFRASRNRTAARQIARSVQPLVDAAVKSDPRTATDLAAKQDTSTERIIDESQGKRVALPI